MIKKSIEKLIKILFSKKKYKYENKKPKLLNTKKNIDFDFKLPKLSKLNFEFLNKFKKLNAKNKSILLLICFVIISFFTSKILFWIAVLMLAVSLSKLIQLIFPLVVGFDWGSFVCIFIAYHIHPIVALVCVSVASVIGSVLRGQRKLDMIALPIFGYISIILFFWLIPITYFYSFGNLAFFIFALIATIIYGLTSILFSYFFMGRIDMNAFSFIITLIINNIYLINYLAPYLVQTMGL